MTPVNSLSPSRWVPGISLDDLCTQQVHSAGSALCMSSHTERGKDVETTERSYSLLGRHQPFLPVLSGVLTLGLLTHCNRVGAETKGGLRPLGRSLEGPVRINKAFLYAARESAQSR